MNNKKSLGVLFFQGVNWLCVFILYLPIVSLILIIVGLEAIGIHHGNGIIAGVIYGICYVLQGWTEKFFPPTRAALTGFESFDDDIGNEDFSDIFGGDDQDSATPDLINDPAYSSFETNIYHAGMHPDH